MPTQNPRVNVTLSPSLDSLVSALAGHERVSKSMVLRELLEAAEPALRQVVALMEAAKGASGEARKRLAADLDQSLKAAEGVQYLMMSVAAGNTRDIVAEAETVRGRRPSASGKVRKDAAPAAPPLPSKAEGNAPHRARNPPSSNRGVK